jgi:phosphatidylglycerol:prolipoprotein diacylglycerol transferase
VLPEIDIFGLGLKTFGLMFALAFVACGALAYRRMQELGKPTDWAYEQIFAALLGGLIGARLWFIIENFDAGDPLGQIFSGSGLVFWGGLIGGALAVILWGLWRGFLGPALVDLAAPAVAIGYAIGRVGCQLSGDGDYGKDSDLPWAMAYPDGTVPTDTPVQPTPIYETVVMGVAAWWLWRMRDRFRPGVLFGFYLVFAGLERFLVEFIRRNDAVLLGLTQAQVTAVLAFVIGAAWIYAMTRKGPLRIDPPAVRAQAAAS